jgi:hypothetical protein
MSADSSADHDKNGGVAKCMGGTITEKVQTNLVINNKKSKKPQVNF